MKPAKNFRVAQYFYSLPQGDLARTGKLCTFLHYTKGVWEIREGICLKSTTDGYLALYSDGTSSFVEHAYIRNARKIPPVPPKPSKIQRLRVNSTIANTLHEEFVNNHKYSGNGLKAVMQCATFSETVAAVCDAIHAAHPEFDRAEFMRKVYS